MRITACPYCGSELVPPFHFCAACGRPVAAPAGYPLYPVLPPHRANLGWIIVLIVVLVIAVPSVLAGVLYIMVSGLLTPSPGSAKPFVTFSSVTKMNFLTWTFSVASASPAVSPSYFKLNFGIGTATGTAMNMGTSGQNVSVTTGTVPATVGISWTDLGGEGTVNAGDTLTIAFPSAPATGTSLTFHLLYSDGSQIQSISWQA